MITRTECYVRCAKCDVTVGRVFAQDLKENGFWKNKPVPNPMPKKCKLCDSQLVRVNP